MRRDSVLTAKETSQRILDVAEQLFAEHGFDATSLRAITKEAGVNLAAVHYHFGSKEALVEQVFARRLGPLNRRRLELLDRAEAEAGGTPCVETILECFYAPALRTFTRPESGHGHFMRLFGRTFTEPNEQMRNMFVEQFGEVVRRFSAALSRALPHLPAEHLWWRMHFMVGAMAHSLSCPHGLRFLSGGRCDPDNHEEALRQLIAFVRAGLRAPVLARQVTS
ncbi:MAG: TetR family transcriptional regulator [Acidobacteriota bacterium]|nr:MAG: TetR family transcriptional regulator [Acidobacteriota bacterium]